MYQNLGIHWAASIPAFLSLMCVPMPYIFWRYGSAIRTRCKYAAEAAAFIQKVQAQVEETESEEENEEQQSEHSIDKAKEHEEEREEQDHQAIDYSYEAEDDQPRLEPVKSTAGRGPTLARSCKSYDNSPFDLDRTNTKDSFRWESGRPIGSRKSSRTSSK